METDFVLSELANCTDMDQLAEGYNKTEETLEQIRSISPNCQKIEAMMRTDPMVVMYLSMFCTKITVKMRISELEEENK